MCTAASNSTSQTKEVLPNSTVRGAKIGLSRCSRSPSPARYPASAWTSAVRIRIPAGPHPCHCKGPMPLVLVPRLVV
jgi:hypothetical protein